MNGRSGFTFLEVVVSLAISAVLVGSAGLLMTHQIAALAKASAVTERAEVARTIFGVLRAELKAGRPGEDWRVVGDTVHLRAFRGVGVPCGSPTSEIDRIWIRADRRPNPAKDSVLVIDGAGRRHRAALSDVLDEWEESSESGLAPCRPTSSAGVGWVQRWNRSWRPPTVETSVPVVVRLFERGSYHLADGALRFRAARGGRQPLTPEILDDERSNLRWDMGQGTVHIELRFQSRPRSAGLVQALSEVEPLPPMSASIWGGSPW